MLHLKAAISNANRKVYKQFFCHVLKAISSDQFANDSHLTETYNIFTKNSLLQSTSIIESYLLGAITKGSTFQERIDTGFDRKLYYDHLTTKKLGTIVLFTKLAKSSMDTFDMLPKPIDNVVVVAQQQTAGKGTHGNEWLSPKGCCMFTLFCNLCPEFSLSRLSLLQFAAGLACVKAIKTNPNLKVYFLLLQCRVLRPFYVINVKSNIII